MPQAKKEIDYFCLLPYHKKEVKVVSVLSAFEFIFFQNEVICNANQYQYG